MKAASLAAVPEREITARAGILREGSVTPAVYADGLFLEEECREHASDLE